jgi:hypothetical protein
LYIFAAPAEALYDWPAQLQRVRGLGDIGAGDWIAGTVRATHCVGVVVGGGGLGGAEGEAAWTDVVIRLSCGFAKLRFQHFRSEPNASDDMDLEGQHAMAGGAAAD